MIRIIPILENGHYAIAQITIVRFFMLLLCSKKHVLHGVVNFELP
jgi:hypothetical protein